MYTTREVTHRIILQFSLNAAIKSQESNNNLCIIYSLSTASSLFLSVGLGSDFFWVKSLTGFINVWLKAGYIDELL